MDTFWIRGSKFGYVMDTRILDTFWIRFGYVMDTFWIRTILDTLWIRFGSISLIFHGFASILQGLPLAISSDFDGFASILQGVPYPLELHRILMDLYIFCKGYPLGFH